MGARGPIPKPTALKIAQGNPGKRVLGDREPIPPSGRVEAPDHLTAGARAIWDRMAPICVAMKTLTVVDVDAFGRYCSWLDKWITLDRWIRDNLKGTPYFYKRDAAGAIVYVGEMPQNAELRAISKILLILEREFGLTPSGRTRIQVEHGAPASIDGPTPPPASSTFRDRFLSPLPFKRA